MWRVCRVPCGRIYIGIVKKIVFLHGLNWSGSCDMARALAEGLVGEAEVVAPDLPVSPEAAMTVALDVCDRVRPDLVAGSSYGAFLGQQLVKVFGCPALLCSPMLHMSEYVSRRLGVHTYKSARCDGAVSYEITPTVVEEFRRMEARQFDCYDEFYRDRVWGLYGSKDTLADTRDEFGRYYSTVIDYDGPHTMLRDNVLQTLVPAARRILAEYPCMPMRTFIHYKGGRYRMLCRVRSSETLERMVAYQGLYGDRLCWVRPLRMFFERVSGSDGRSVPRFAECAPD